MTPEHWLREKAVFTEVMGLTPEERRNYLDATCADDPALRAGVERLLTHYDKAETESFLSDSFLAPSWATDGIPTTLDDFDDYERIEYLGHGGMGVVYRAFDKTLRRWVALKMILPRHLNNLAIVSLFGAESRTMAPLNHPNTVQVYHRGEHDGRAYFTMTLIEGATLNQRLGEFRQNPRRAAELLVKVARAIDYAHQPPRGILHRDLKPGNILLDKDGRPWVTDHGLAKQLEADDPLLEGTVSLETASRVFGGIIGTICYMSPEQATPGEKLGTASDVYGLGAVLYATLTGRPPFKGKDVWDTLGMVRDADCKPDSPRALNPLVDRDLEAICLKCLDKNPARRYRTAEEFAADLERWRDGRETTSRPWSRPYRLLRWAARNRVTAALIVLAVTLVALFDVSNAISLRRERERQVLRSNALTARSVANTFQARLQLLSSAASREASGDELRKDMVSGDRAKLQRHAERIWASSNGFWRQRKDYPVESWFILDREGRVVAHSNKASSVVNQLFNWRDYFRGAIAKTEAGAAHVSRAYRSHLADENYKFAVASPIRREDEVIGVLVATVTTNSAKGTLLPEGTLQDAALVGRWDGTPPEPSDPNIPTEIHPRGQRLILLHSAFERGDMAVEAPDGALFDERAYREHGHATDSDYADPVASRNPAYSGRWLAAAAPVEDTEFVVIVKQRYDEAVQPSAIFDRLRVMWGVVISLALICVVAMARAWWKEGERPRWLD